MHTLNSLAYSVARRAFWLLPAVLRNRLHGMRYELAYHFRNRTIRDYPPREGDLNWDAFRESMLLQSSRFRAVIIFEPNVDWGIQLFQRPQHMATALGRIGCLVIYKTTGDKLTGFRQVAKNVWLANDDAVDSIDGAIRCYYSTSLFAMAAKMRAAKAHGPVVYEYIDHIDASISGGPSSLTRLNELKNTALEGVADLVVASAKVLFEEAVHRRGSAHCLYLPNGVDVDHYQGMSQLSVVLPKSLAGFRQSYRSVVGYFGAIAPWLWFEVIDQVASQMHDMGFVFIGPDYSGCVSQLPRRSNIFYAGEVEYAVLPAYGRAFDVCFIPFRPGNIAQSTSPLKLFEYFALEKPVVVTADMAECIAFAEVFSGNDAASLVAAIKQGMSMKDDPDFRGRLRMLANANSWSVRANSYCGTISQLLGK